MKKVLLTTTAMAFAASVASAGDMSMSGAIKLTYGAFGTGTSAAGLTISHQKQIWISLQQVLVVTSL